jgi:uncharacterized lipoprotein YddW (UPF0748 family)
MDRADPSLDKTWHQFRLDQLVQLVRGIARAVHDRGSIITGAVFPTPQMSRTMVRQDWARFDLDAYLPMLYNGFYLKPTDWIAECIKEARTEIGGSVPIYAGLMMSPDIFTPGVLARTIRQVKEAGGQGISAFTAGGLNKAQLRILRGEV